MPLKIFICYAHEDEALLNRLKSHLKPLQRQSLIDVWYDRAISAGTNWEQEIDEHLNNAQVILLLVSPDFMNSDYCYGYEMKRALERHERGEARVIPITLRPVYSKDTPFSKLQALPTDARPAISWADPDTAFYEITVGIVQAIDGWLGLDNYPETAAQAIRKCYCQLGNAEIDLGVPAPISSSDTFQITSGRGTHGYKRSFTKGAIYWGGSGDAYPVYGAIGYLYHQHPDIAKRLGFPTQPAVQAASSRQGTTGDYQRFERGIIVSSEKHTVPVAGQILDVYLKFHGSRGRFGFPLAQESTVTDNSIIHLQEFEGGVICVAR